MTRFNVYFGDRSMGPKIRNLARRLGYAGPCEMIRQVTTKFVRRQERELRKAQGE